MDLLDDPADRPFLREHLVGGGGCYVRRLDPAELRAALALDYALALAERLLAGETRLASAS